MDEDEASDEDLSSKKASAEKKILKRSLDSDSEVSPKKKKLDEKKPAHAATSSASVATSDKNSQMPSIFQNKKFFISKNVEKFSEIKRYIIAYVYFTLFLYASSFILLLKVFYLF